MKHFVQKKGKFDIHINNKKLYTKLHNMLISTSIYDYINQKEIFHQNVTLKIIQNKNNMPSFLSFQVLARHLAIYTF